MADEKPKRTREKTEEAQAPEAQADEAVVTETEADAEPEAAATESTPEPAADEKPARKTPAAKAAKPRAAKPAAKKKKKREASGERKPIVRLPKPEHARGRRQERRGVVVSNAMDKTIVVKVDTIKSHPRYKKVVRRSTKFHAHDETNVANVGDIVRIVETRPLSALKRWRLAEVMERAR
jgi:small subunit ribosomal protein S17